MKKYLLVFFLALNSFAGLSEDLHKSVVQIHGLTNSGSGFVAEAASGARYIVTNQHVCKTTKTFRVTFSATGDEEYSDIVAIDAAHDLCLIGLKDQSKPAIPLATDFTEDKTVMALGHPNGGPYKESSGPLLGGMSEPDFYPSRYCTPEEEIINLEGEAGCVRQFVRLVAQLTVAPGSSGGPLVTNTGKVLGVVYSTNGVYTSSVFVLHLYELLSRF